MEVASGHLEYEQPHVSAVSTRPLTGLWHEAAHLPIEQMAKVKLVINLKTAKRSASWCRSQFSPAPTRSSNNANPPRAALRSESSEGPVWGMGRRRG